MKRNREYDSDDENPRKRQRYDESPNKTTLEQEEEKLREWEEKQNEKTGGSSSFSRRFSNEPRYTKWEDTAKYKENKVFNHGDYHGKQRNSPPEYDERRMDDRRNADRDRYERDKRRRKELQKMNKIKFIENFKSPIEFHSFKQNILKRDKIRRILKYKSLPISKLKTLLANRFVRYVVGHKLRDKNDSAYAIGFIIKVIEDDGKKNPQYKVDTIYTNLYMILAVDGVVRKCRMDRISNSPITKEEFTNFCHCIPVPKKEKIKSDSMFDEDQFEEDNELELDDEEDSDNDDGTQISRKTKYKNRNKGMNIDELDESLQKDLRNYNLGAEITKNLVFETLISKGKELKDNVAKFEEKKNKEQLEAYIKQEQYDKVPYQRLRDLLSQLNLDIRVYRQNNAGKTNEELERKISKISKIVGPKTDKNTKRNDLINNIQKKKNMKHREHLKKVAKINANKNIAKSSKDRIEDMVYKRKTTTSSFGYSGLGSRGKEKDTELVETNNTIKMLEKEKAEIEERSKQRKLKELNDTKNKKKEKNVQLQKILEENKQEKNIHNQVDVDLEDLFDDDDDDILIEGI